MFLMFLIRGLTKRVNSLEQLWKLSAMYVVITLCAHILELEAFS